MRRRRSWLRGEGHVEYVILTSLIMVCALVSFFSMVQNIKDTAADIQICIDCDDPVKDKVHGEDDPDSPDGDTADKDDDGWPEWLSWLRNWFKHTSGSPWLYA